MIADDGHASPVTLLRSHVFPEGFVLCVIYEWNKAVLPRTKPSFRSNPDPAHRFSTLTPCARAAPSCYRLARATCSPHVYGWAGAEGRLEKCCNAAVCSLIQLVYRETWRREGGSFVLSPYAAAGFIECQRKRRFTEWFSPYPEIQSRFVHWCTDALFWCTKRSLLITTRLRYNCWGSDPSKTRERETRQQPRKCDIAAENYEIVLYEAVHLHLLPC